jgi:hypothetical protein
MFKSSLLSLVVVFSFSACLHNPIYKGNNTQQTQDKKKKKDKKKCNKRGCKNPHHRH